MRPGRDDALLTDLYQLTMAQAYLEHGLTETAEFEFFVRDLPDERNFLLAAGLEQVLDYLEGLAFDEAALTWLESTGRFSRTLLDWLAGLSFTGDVDAVPEGTAVFADEPLLRVRAPMPLAQLVESRIINLLHFQTLIASRAARVRLAAGDRLLVDFGMRRAHGAEAGVLAARAARIAGFDGTATVAAGRAFGIPLYGTMAHSFIEAHPDEVSAFRHFLASHPGSGVLLIDTWDTERAAHRVVELAREDFATREAIKGVRIDSGDLGDHARRVRRILDEGGLEGVTIFASGNLDEYAIADLAADGVPVDGLGVGTRLDVASDAPYLDCAYKLQSYAGTPRRKRSEGKGTWAGPKQIHREHRAGRMAGDRLTTADEAAPGHPLLHPVLRGGEPVTERPRLAAIRETAAAELAALPEALRSLEPAVEPYPVHVSERLRAVTAEADRLGDAPT
ncbi:MAG: nicotinate phosphoribosyltransferase [Thiohalospira sp.]